MPPIVPHPGAQSEALNRFRSDLVAAFEKGVPKGMAGLRGERALKQRFIEERAKVIRRAYPELISKSGPAWSPGGRPAPAFRVMVTQCWPVGVTPR